MFEWSASTALAFGPRSVGSGGAEQCGKIPGFSGLRAE
jgi:hypothetical protein